MFGALIHEASLQISDGVLPLLSQMHRLSPFLNRSVPMPNIAVTYWPPVSRQTTPRGLTSSVAFQGTNLFEALPRPRLCVVDRAFSLFGRRRRMAKDLETMVQTSRAWLEIWMPRLLIRRSQDPPISNVFSNGLFRLPDGRNDLLNSTSSKAGGPRERTPG